MRPARMPPVSLYAICVKRTCDFMMSGVWTNYGENPFSVLPTSIIQDLLSFMLPADSKVNRDKIVNVRLLLASNRLEHVDLLNVVHLEDYVSLFRVLSLGCQNLRTLLLPDYVYMEYIWIGSEEVLALGELLLNCPNLKELHSNIFFDPNDLRNCRDLSSLKLHFDVRTLKEFFHRVSLVLLQRLPSLKVFSFCYPHEDMRYTIESVVSTTAAILDAYPELTSLGFLDSTMALKELHSLDCRRFGALRRFQLRRCYWPGAGKITHYGYCDMIRVAALCCPMLEALVMTVRYAGCLKHLKALKNLSFLHIDFSQCGDEYEQEFYSFLDEIGPQLRHLSFKGLQNKPGNLHTLCNSCPNLSTLVLVRGVTVDEAAYPCVGLQNLKRLNVKSCDREGLFFLLRNCISLKTLCLNDFESLDDGLLNKILQKNSFAELEVALMAQSSLSSSALVRFVQSAGKLRKISLGSTLLIDDEEIKRCVRDLNPSVVCHPWYNSFDIERKEFPEFYQECWL